MLQASVLRKSLAILCVLIAIAVLIKGAVIQHFVPSDYVIMGATNLVIAILIYTKHKKEE